MVKIKITCGRIELIAQLFDTPTAKRIADVLPLTGRVNRWGAEVYFSIPVDTELEPDARDVLQPGELGFWPVGKAFCIFWGPTPASLGEESRAASDVNVCGQVEGDASVLETARSGSDICIEALSINEES